MRIKAIGIILAMALSLGLAAAGCDGGGGGGGNGNAAAPDTALYRVAIVNLTNNQPLSPPALVLHTRGYQAWTLGESPSPGVERLAEGGITTDLIREAEADASVLAVTAGQEAIAPGRRVTFEIMVADELDLRLTTAAMLVNTNDGFCGALDWRVGDLMAGESRRAFVPALDAGTEMNTESPASIPGPAAGGQGFNAVRDEGDLVLAHPGVVTADDGLPGSALDQSHRFDNPVALVIVTRVN